MLPFVIGVTANIGVDSCELWLLSQGTKGAKYWLASSAAVLAAS
jgi:hypothetical protein